MMTMMSMMMTTMPKASRGYDHARKVVVVMMMTMLTGRMMLIMMMMLTGPSG